jgi:tetratricopeptide (TPR) repeat protein
MTQPQALTPSQAQQLGRAFVLLQQGKPGDALSVALAVAGAVPQSADAHHLIALCHKAAGRQRECEASFRKALDFAPAHAEILVNYANFLRSLGRLPEALELHRAAVTVAAGMANAWSGLGLTALAAGRVTEARDALERAVDVAPRSGTAWHGLGRARRASGDLPGAEAAFRKTVALEPGNGAAWINLSVVLKLLGRPAEALPFVETARKAGFSGPELLDAEIGALADLGRIEEAIERSRLLVRSAPEYTAGHVTLAHLLWEHGSALAPGEDPAAAFCEAALGQPANAPLQLAYVRFLMEAGRAGEALARVRTVRAAAPAPSLAIVEASALDELGERREAAALFEQIYLEMGVRDPAFLNAWCRHLLRAHRPDAAAARALEATSAEPDNQGAWGYLATAWRLLDDPREFWLCDYEHLIGLVEVEPPSGYGSVGDFLARVRVTLDPLHKAAREPVNQSLRGGSQTPGRLFGRPDPLIREAQEAVTRAVERHIASLPDDPEHPFLRRKKRSVLYAGSWSVKLWSAGRHVNHFHPQGWMSSAWYISLPPSVASGRDESDRTGWIQFGQPPEHLGLDLEPRRYIRPQAGCVALFPSYMWHGTVPFEDSEPRITVAFDMTPSD